MTDPLLIVADERPKPPVVSPRAVAAVEVLLDVMRPDDDPFVGHHALTIDVLRKVSVSLDQLVNRARDEARKYGEPLPANSPAHAGDFAECDRLARTLEVAAACARKMIAGVKGQFPKPAPAPRGRS
jgi:hypothetical protein